MTGAVAAITITGTIYGAGLKGEQEVKQVCLIITRILEPKQLLLLPCTASSHTDVGSCSKNDKFSKPHQKNELHSSRSRAPSWCSRKTRWKGRCARLPSAEGPKRRRLRTDNEPGRDQIQLLL
jgi:hypothetical protein